MSNVYVFFSAQYLPTVGGVERYVDGVCNQLAKIDANSKIYIVTSEIENLPQKEQNGNITIIRLPTILLMNGRMPIVKYNKITKRLLKPLLKEKIKLVVLSTRLYPLSLLGSIFAKKVKAPSIAIEHGQAHVEFGKWYITKVVSVYEHMLLGLIKINTKNFAAVSKGCAEWLEHFKIKTDLIMYNSVDFDVLDNIKVDKKIQNQAIYTGRIIKEKGVLQLVQAFNELPQYTLIMVGDGDMLEYLKTIAKDNIIFTGKQDYQETIKLLKQSSLFCLPSDSEGFATSSLEAAYCEVPILITNVSGAKELVTSEKYGTILQANTTQAIKTGVVNTIGKIEQENLKELKNYVKDNFSFLKNAQIIKDFNNLC